MLVEIGDTICIIGIITIMVGFLAYFLLLLGGLMLIRIREFRKDFLDDTKKTQDKEPPTQDKEPPLKAIVLSHSFLAKR